MLGKRLRTANIIARRVRSNYYRRYRFPEDNLENLLPLGRYRKVRKFCSGYCCGNPRKWFGRRTRQELKVLQDEEYRLPPLPPDPRDYHELISYLRERMDEACGMTVSEDRSGVIVIGSHFRKP